MHELGFPAPAPEHHVDVTCSNISHGIPAEAHGTPAEAHGIQLTDGHT